MRISVKLVNRDVDHWAWKTGLIRISFETAEHSQ